MRDFDGTLFFFRVIEPTRHKPNSVDEVRERVVSDLKRLAHYHALEARPARSRSRPERGLLAMAVAHDTIVQRKATVARCNPRQILSQISNRSPCSHTCIRCRCWARTARPPSDHRSGAFAALG